MAKAPLGALRLFGVTALDGANGGRSLAPSTSLVAFRDLGAIVADAPYAAPHLAPEEVEEHQRIVEAVFAHAAILPAPAGVVFRTRDMLVRWLELHYVTLSDALGYIEGRVAARVHIARPAADDGAATPHRTLARAHPEAIAPGDVAATPDAGHAATSVASANEAALADLHAAAAESFRVLRRHAVASLSVRPPEDRGEEIVSSFLLERERWSVFADIVREEGKRRSELTYGVTGPWPPYDFVRMQFGA